MIKEFLVAGYSGIMEKQHSSTSGGRQVGIYFGPTHEKHFVNS